MTTKEAIQRAKDLLDHYHLTGWRVKLDNAKKRIGHCKHSEKVISLSRPCVEINDNLVIEDVIRHEIAHAVVGPGYGHGPKWKQTASALGANPRRNAASAISPRGKWQATCPGCNLKVYRHRKPKRGYSCADCWPSYNPKFKFVYGLSDDT